MICPAYHEAEGHCAYGNLANRHRSGLDFINVGHVVKLCLVLSLPEDTALPTSARLSYKWTFWEICADRPKISENATVLAGTKRAHR